MIILLRMQSAVFHIEDIFSPIFLKNNDANSTTHKIHK